MGLLAQRVEVHDGRGLLGVGGRTEASHKIAQEDRLHLQKLRLRYSVGESSHYRVIKESFENHEMLNNVFASLRVSPYQVFLKLDVVLRRRHFTVRHVPDPSGFLDDVEALVRPRVLLLAFDLGRSHSGSTSHDTYASREHWASLVCRHLFRILGF